MKLFVRDSAQNKIYLQVIAPTRYELARVIGSPWFTLNGEQYHVHQVVAENEGGNTATGAIIGGIIGLIGGPVGILIGGSLGGALGNEGDKSDKVKVNRFNTSRI